MPRTLFVIPPTVVLLGVLTSSSPMRTAPPVDATLPLLVSEGKAPAAALLIRNTDTSPGSHFVRAGHGMDRSDRFRAGSITKSFLATVVLQLAAENRLALSDPVDRHLPGLVRGMGNDGRTITLRALLTHTSGLYDYTRTAPLPRTPGRAVAAALSHPPTRPGVWSYSNTNYVVLGMVVERVTGVSYADAIRRRIITPLRLTGTSLPGSRTTLPDPHGRAYSAEGHDVTALDPRVAGAAGELVSTLADLDRFYAALLEGELLPRAQRDELLNTRTADGAYGMGLFPERLSCGRTVWGHNGRISGSYVRTAATRDGSRVLTFRVNTDTLAEPDLEQDVLESEFCT